MTARLDPHQSSDERARVDRAERAARVPDGVDTLISMLGDPSWVVRRRVVSFLATAGEAAVAPMLAELTGKRGDETRNAAVVDALSASDVDITPQLVALASDPDPAIVSDVAQILGRRRSKAAIPTLTKLALGGDDNVAVSAIEALGRIGGRASVECLVQLVKSGSFFRTFPAIDVLGRSGDPRAIGPLSELLADPRYSLEAMRALARTGDSAAAAPLALMLAQRSPTSIRVAAVAISDYVTCYVDRHGDDGTIEQLLGSAIPAGAVRSLEASLAGANIIEQQAIARVLGIVGDPAAVTVLTRLVDGTPDVARRAVESLARNAESSRDELCTLLREGDSGRRSVLLPIASQRTTDAKDVVQCLNDPDGNVRAMAATALGKMGAVAQLGELFDLLQDPNPRVVQAAAGAIQSLGSAEIEQRTLELLEKGNARVRCEALRIARYFGFDSALAAATAAVRQDDERLREAAMMALSSMEDARAQEVLLEQIVEPSSKVRAIAARALGHRPPSDLVRTAVIEAAGDDDPWVRYYAAQALGRLRDEASLPVLERLLRDIAGQVRLAAIEALSHLAGERAFAALREASRSPDEDIRRASVMGLGINKRPEALPLVVEALADGDAATRLVAVSALSGFDAPETIAHLARMVRDPDKTVSLTAIGLLAERDSEESTQALARLLDLPEHVDRVKLALSSPSTRRIRGIAKELESADDEASAILVSALVRMRTPESSTALVAALKSRNVAARKASAATLGALLPAEQVREALRAAAATDPDREVRAVAALASSRG